MSALPLKADMCGARGDVRYGPIADIEKDYQSELCLKTGAHEVHVVEEGDKLSLLRA